MRCYRIALTIGVLGMPMGLAAQADSTADSTLAQPSSLGSRTTIRGAALRSLLADDPQHVLGLVPGVVLRQAETGLARAGVLSIRGGVPGGASVYIDGAPVRFLNLGTAGVVLGPASVAEVAVSTGVPDLGLPDVRDGVIEYLAQSGGQKLAGGVRAVTDEGLVGVGFTRFDGSVGGPLLGLANVTFFVSGTVMGQRSHYLGLGAENVPSYVPVGIDTIVSITSGSTTREESLPLFADRRSYDWGTDFRGHAKVQFTAPSGGIVSITGVVNELQERFFPGMFALVPSLYTGARAGARFVVANWRQPLGSLMGGPLALSVNGSIASNRTAAGLLEPWSEVVSRDPGLGITLETLRFTGDDSIPTPVTDQLIRNIRSNTGLRVPFLNRDDLRNVQWSRGNPYGMETSWPNGTLDGTLSMSSEQRTDARVALEWVVLEAHHVTVGGDVGTADVSSYTSSLLRQSFMDVYRSKPGRAGIHISDRIGRGDLRAEIAVRYDHFGSVGLFPTVPGRIYSHPAFNRPAAISTDTGYTNSVARVMTPGLARNAVSLRVAVQQNMGLRTAVRAAFGRWVEPPPLGVVLLGSNSDLDFTNTNDLFGRDVDYGHASLAEVGVRHDVRQGLAVDVVLYRRTRPMYGFRIQPFDDPANPGDIANVNSLATLEDMVDVGSDIALDWRAGSWLTSRVAYGLRLSDPAGTSGPFGPIDGPGFATHALTIGAVARAPGGLLRGVEASLLFRMTNGLPYTRLDPAGGTGLLALRGDFGLVNNAVETLNSSRLPWTRNLDLRLTKVVEVGSQDLMAFADFRNVLNFKNILNLFAETGDVENANFRQQRLDVEYGNIESEAILNGRLLANGDIDLVPNCASWTVAGGSGGPVMNCVALRRAEARFGNGDGLYSLAERETALNAFFDAFYGPQMFYGAGRSVRLGVEFRW